MSFSMDLSCYFEASPMDSPLSPLGAEFQFWGVEEDSEASYDDSSSEDEFDTENDLNPSEWETLDDIILFYYHQMYY